MISNRYLVFLVFIQLNIGRFFAQGNETMTLNKSNRQIDDMIKFIKKKTIVHIYLAERPPNVRILRIDLFVIAQQYVFNIALK